MTAVAHQATVEVLRAEVRVLMVGSRQVTLSVYRQLDRADPDLIEPFGRVRDGQDDARYINVVGVNKEDGTLTRSRVLNETSHDEWWKPSDHLGGIWNRYSEQLDKHRLGVTQRRTIATGTPYLVLYGRMAPRLFAQVSWGRLGQTEYVSRDPMDRLLPDLPQEIADDASELKRKYNHADAFRLDWLSLPLIVLAGLR